VRRVQLPKTVKVTEKELLAALNVSRPDAVAGCLHEIIEVLKEYDKRLSRLEAAIFEEHKCKIGAANRGG